MTPFPTTTANRCQLGTGVFQGNECIVTSLHTTENEYLLNEGAEYKYSSGSENFHIHTFLNSEYLLIWEYLKWISEMKDKVIMNWPLFVGLKDVIQETAN